MFFRHRGSVRHFFRRRALRGFSRWRKTGFINAEKRAENAGYIDIKYSGGSLYCIAPIKKYEPEPEQIILPEPELRLPEKAKRERKYLLPFLAAFSGGALGSLLVSLTFALI